MLKNIFRSMDGLTFPDELSCAIHEINNCDSIKEQLKTAIKNENNQSMNHWCMNEVCCCVGCVNFSFISNGLSKYHWAAYFKQTPITFINESVAFNLKMESFKDEEKTIRIIRIITGLSQNESKLLLKKDSLLKIEISLIDAEIYQKKLLLIGTITEIIEIRY
jgi:hypothetical protein